jgi:hypothetical protein
MATAKDKQEHIEGKGSVHSNTGPQWCPKCRGCRNLSIVISKGLGL